MIKCKECNKEKPDNYYYLHEIDKTDKVCKKCQRHKMDKIVLQDGHKNCYECGTQKLITDFHKHVTGRDGRATRCKECSCTYQRKRTRLVQQGLIERGDNNPNVAEIYLSKEEVISYSTRLLDRIRRADNCVGLMDIADIIECYQQMSGKIHLSQSMKAGEEIVSMVAYITETLKKEE